MGSRDDTRLLARVTGHSGCFLCNKTAPMRRLGAHQTHPQSSVSGCCFSVTSHSRSIQLVSRPPQGIRCPDRWFRDGSTQGHTSRWAGAQEGKQPLTIPEPAAACQHQRLIPTSSHQGPARSLPAKRMPRGAGRWQSSGLHTGCQSQAGHTHIRASQT